MKLTIQRLQAAKPSDAQFKKWVKAALPEAYPAEFTLRLVDEVEMTHLNSTYRHKAGATNVLSFSYTTYQGDLVLCAPVVLREAKAQQKSDLAHFAHLTVHGVLHLLGYDHQTKVEAQVMEAQEIAILKALGFKNPYGEHHE